MTYITEILKQKDSIELVKSRIKSDNETIFKWVKKLQAECPHPTTVTKTKYHDGGYDYLSSMSITVTCTICEKLLESYDDPKHVGHYG